MSASWGLSSLYVSEFILSGWVEVFVHGYVGDLGWVGRVAGLTCEFWAGFEDFYFGERQTKDGRSSKGYGKSCGFAKVDGSWKGVELAGRGGLDGERWAEEFHVVLAEEGCVLEGSVGLGDVFEEGLHFAGGGEGDEESSGSAGDAGEGVGYATWA